MEERFQALERRVTALEAALNPPVQTPPPVTDFETLTKMLQSPEWPAAVDPPLICNTTSDQDKEDRAEGILDLIIDVNLENLALLDFGCGEGHLSWKALAQKPKISVGFDIEDYNWKRWPAKENLFFHTDWEAVKQRGPYHVVVLYDVLDHIGGEDNAEILECLRRIRQVMALNATLFVRCHPFVARHGTHLYHQINKAYAHLVFTPDEIASLGYKAGPHTRHIVHPVGIYRQWFQLANFKVRHEQIVREPIEGYFSGGGLITERIKNHWKSSPKVELSSGQVFPFVQIEQQFVDFQLE